MFMERSRGGRRNLALVGFMGAGKSTVGPVLASRLGLTFVDLDERIAAGAGMDIGEIFSREGEEGFRARESEALRRELRGRGKVIACGGGIVLRRENVELLRDSCMVCYLDADMETLLRRLEGGEGRPLLQGGELSRRVEELVEARREKYREAAHLVVDVGEKSAEEIAGEIAEAWKRYR